MYILLPKNNKTKSYLSFSLITHEYVYVYRVEYWSYYIKCKYDTNYENDTMIHKRQNDGLKITTYNLNWISKNASDILFPSSSSLKKVKEKLKNNKINVFHYVFFFTLIVSFVIFWHNKTQWNKKYKMHNEKTLNFSLIDIFF